MFEYARDFCWPAGRHNVTVDGFRDSEKPRTSNAQLSNFGTTATSVLVGKKRRKTTTPSFMHAGPGRSTSTQPYESCNSVSIS